MMSIRTTLQPIDACILCTFFFFLKDKHSKSLKGLYGPGRAFGQGYTIIKLDMQRDYRGCGVGSSSRTFEPCDSCFVTSLGSTMSTRSLARDQAFPQCNVTGELPVGELRETQNVGKSQPWVLRRTSVQTRKCDTAPFTGLELRLTVMNMSDKMEAKAALANNPRVYSSCNSLYSPSMNSPSLSDHALLLHGAPRGPRPQSR